MRPPQSARATGRPARRLRRASRLLALAILGLLALPLSASAADQLDQSQTAAAANASALQYPSELAQTFTAGVTGRLDRVQLLLSNPGIRGSVPLLVQITTVSGGQPTSTVLASATVEPAEVDVAKVWLNVEFSPSAPSEMGSQYAIVLSMPAADSSCLSGQCYVWPFASGNPYNQGSALRSDDGGATWAQAFGDADFDFQTFVSPPDSTPPTTTIALSPASPNGSNGWYTSPVGVSVTATDDSGGSGVQETRCALDPASVPLTFGDLPAVPCTLASVSADGNHTVYAASEDNANNTEAVQSVSFKIDQTAPTVTYTGDKGSYGILAQVAITCTAADGGSGIASSTCANATGPGWSFGAGAHTLSASATDEAGNTGKGSASFTVTVAPQDLCTLTDQFVDGSPRYKALPPLARLVVNALVKASCSIALSIGPRVAPAQKQRLINSYRAAVQGLVQPGWLTQAQASTLASLAGAL